MMNTQACSDMRTKHLNALCDSRKAQAQILDGVHQVRENQILQDSQTPFRSKCTDIAVKICKALGISKLQIELQIQDFHLLMRQGGKPGEWSVILILSFTSQIRQGERRRQN